MDKIYKSKITSRQWSVIVIFGLIGQIAWIIENMYLNLFIDRTISTNPFAISVMVALSAIVATFATLIIGILSDKIGNRKRIMSWGYLLWGGSIMLFALISVDNTMSIFNLNKSQAIIWSIVFVIILDCVMTFIGSSSNDACFNAWVTENTQKTNRGRVEGILATMPLLAMGVIFGGLDFITQDTYKNPITQEVRRGWAEGFEKVAVGDWTLFFVIIGSLVAIAGIIGLFTIKDSPNLQKSSTASLKNIWFGFKSKTIKQNKHLYLIFIIVGIMGISNNTIMPYLIMYIERTLGFSNFIIPVGLIVALSGVGSVAFGFIIDKTKDRRKYFLPLTIIYIISAILMYFASPVVFEKGSITLLVVMCSVCFFWLFAFLSLTASLTATVRDLTPKDRAGAFQGVRMFFYILIPMVIGPMLTAIININSPIIATDIVNNIEIREYTPLMFLVCASIACFMIYPIIKLVKVPIEQIRAKE